MKSARVFFLVIFSALAASGATLRVPQDFATVQDAVAASVAGDTIVVSPGLYAIPASPCTLANGSQHTCGLVLHNGTALVGSGPAQTILDFSGAQIGILLQFGTATVKLFHLRNTTNHIFAYVGSNITVNNVILTDPVGSSVGIELNQGNSYTIHNTTVDNQHKAGTFGIDVPFFGTVDIQNNLVTNGDRAFTAGSFVGGTYTYNDAFGSTIADWSTCGPVGCTAVRAPANNISADPLYCPNFSLQTGSPARNAGNPAILNPDGTRSDLGAYGGPEAILPTTPCGFLSFPLRNKRAFTAKINTVFDHHASYQYCADGVVTAYTGEEGRSDFGSSFAAQFKCHLTNVSNRLFGYQQDSFGTRFSVNGQYVGAGTPQFLFYDGHPGYDYRTTDQNPDGSPCPGGNLCNPSGKTRVLAAAAGTVICVTTDTVKCPEGPGEVKLDHGNGFFSIYLHLSRSEVVLGQNIAAGQEIGISGDVGAPNNPHLHFEVRKTINGIAIPVDPYGWQGANSDPYTRAANINLWK